MTRNVNAAFVEEKNKKINKPLFLYVLYDYDGNGNDLHFAGAKGNKWFPTGVQEFVAFPISHDQISENASGQIEGVNVTVGDAMRIIRAYLHLYSGLRRKRIEIISCWADHLDDADNCIRDNYWIETAEGSPDGKYVTFVCKPITDVFGKKIPGRTYHRAICDAVFKDSDTCQYAEAEAECNHTKQRCKELGNLINFNAEPGIPAQIANG